MFWGGFPPKGCGIGSFPPLVCFPRFDGGGQSRRKALLRLYSSLAPGGCAEGTPFAGHTHTRPPPSARALQDARGPQLPGSPAPSSLLSGGEGADDAPRQTRGGKSLLQRMGARTAQEPSGAGIGTAAPGAEARVVPARIPGSEHKGIGRAFAARLGRRRPRSKIGEGWQVEGLALIAPLPERKKEGGKSVCEV